MIIESWQKNQDEQSPWFLQEMRLKTAELFKKKNRDESGLFDLGYKHLFLDYSYSMLLGVYVRIVRRSLSEYDAQK